ncbi:uncharacterized protein LOC142590344 [Dermacentor variabilis]|uniref:uncharacterized protein LOC142590344 n=1 Tax=Dermacentor variabilis TaxID=34621 RepID=UPI003F5C3B55
MPAAANRPPANESTKQKSNISVIPADLQPSDVWATATDDTPTEKDHQELQASPAVAGEPPLEGTMVTILPVSKGKRVSIDPNPTIDILTPQSSSPTSSVERDMMRTLPIMRQCAVRAASSATSQPFEADEQAETTMESGKGPMQAARKSFSKGTSSSVGKRGTRAFVHSEPVQLELLTDQHPLMSTTLVVRRKPRHRQLVVFAVGLIVASVVAAAFSLLIVRRVREHVVARVSVCSTEDCVNHARRLRHRMNTSVNPCHDFYAYVCGGGDSDGGSPARKSAWRTRQQAAELVRALSQPSYSLFSKHASTAAYKALSALDSCIAREDDRSAGLFVSFMRDRRLPWPERPGKPLNLAEVLDILFDLAVNWRVALWFDVRFSHLGAEGRLVMTLEEPGPVPLYRMEQVSDLDERAYGDAVRALALFLTKGNIKLEEGSIRELYLDESGIRDVVLSSDEEPDAWVLPNDTDHTFNVSAEEWDALVNKYLGASGFSTSHHVDVLAIHRENFDALARLLSELPTDRLLAAAGWTLAYSYAWATNPSLDAFTLSKTTTASPTYRVQVTLCFLAVHESHGITMVAPMFMDVYSAEQQERVVAVVNRTAEALTSAVRISTVLASETKKKVAVKIAAHVYRNFWPPEPFVHSEVLDLLYDKFPIASGSFFLAWLQSRKALRASITNPYYASLMLARYRWRSSRVLYLYALNVMLVGLATVFPPSYLHHGSHAMTYAGLGFQLARQMVRAVDNRGRLLTFDGRPEAPPKDNQTSQKCRLAMAKTSTERRVVRDLFALDLSLAAMKDAVAADSTPLQLKSLEHLGPEETFYVSYCDHFCDEQPQERAQSMCNLAVNGSGFSQAFGCDARTDGTHECLFF